jgi:hypothetical protein
MKYVINRNFPLPTKGTRIYPFNEMQVGDNIFVPLPEGHRARNAAYQYALRVGVKFTSTTTYHRGAVGIRIWRAA